ncbi:MAG: HAD family hydrolase [Candidatus Brocadiia bacterium]|nr:HAD family hydrolase [Candidatus Brocadiia bacterium]
MEESDYELVALDLDGTVLDSSKRVGSAFKEAVARLAAGGVRTVVCTGRRWRSTLPVFDEIESAHPVVISCGGALVKEAGTHRVLRADPLPMDVARETVLVFRRAGLVPFVLYDRPSTERELLVSELDRERLLRVAYFERNADSFDYYPGEWWECEAPPLVVYTVDHASLAYAARDRAREVLGDRALVTALAHTLYGPDQVALEIHSPTATKWSALSWLLERLQIPAERVIAIGDDVNDVPMLRGAGLSFAMANAQPEVKAVADRVTTGSNDEDGVLHALRSVFPILAGL